MGRTPFTITLDMSGQRKQAMELANVVQEWRLAYQSNPNDETRKVHNLLCEVLDGLNTWLEKKEGRPRNIKNRVLGPIQKTWSVL